MRTLEQSQHSPTVKSDGRKQRTEKFASIKANMTKDRLPDFAPNLILFEETCVVFIFNFFNYVKLCIRQKKRVISWFSCPATQFDRLERREIIQ
jgi:hypothetical protein